MEEILPVVILVAILPWINWVLQTRSAKSFLPSDKGFTGFGKIIGYVSLHTFAACRISIIQVAHSSSRITKQVVGERFGPNKKTEQDTLGSFIRHGLTQEETESETVLQV